MRRRSERVVPFNPLEHDRFEAPGPPRKKRREWKQTLGPLTFFNDAPREDHLPVVEAVPLAVEGIRSAFVSGRIDPDMAGDPQLYSGAVYREDGKIVPEFLEHDQLTATRPRRRVNPETVEQSRIAMAPRLERQCVYLGDLQAHFGIFFWSPSRAPGT